MDSNRANRSFVEVSGLYAITKLSRNLRVLQIGPPKHPCGSSTAARYHCVRRPRAAAGLDEKRGLENTIRICKYFYDYLDAPFTRLLLDSNFVSITDMADWAAEGGIEKNGWVGKRANEDEAFVSTMVPLECKKKSNVRKLAVPRIESVRFVYQERSN